MQGASDNLLVAALSGSGLGLQIWSSQTALLLRSCRGHDGEVTDLAINMESSMVASSSNDQTIRCWSLQVCYHVQLNLDYLMLCPGPA